MNLRFSFLFASMTIGASYASINPPRDRDLQQVETPAPVCDPVSIDFAGLSSGDALPTDFYDSLNVTVVGTPKDAQRCGGAHIIDTLDPRAGCDPLSSGDGDLFSPTLGNALVLKNNSASPCIINDCGRGGNITFTFSNKINVKYIQLLDVNEPASVYVEYADGSNEDVGLATGADGAGVQFDVNRNNVVTLTVSFTRSGAIAEVFFKKCGDIPGGSGDPHFKTWAGHKFDYHGQCDMLFTHAPKAVGGKGLDIHIRTKQQDFYSYINQVAIKVGSSDVLEIGHTSVLLNGVSQDLPLSDLSLAGNPVLYKKVITSNGREQQTYHIILDEDTDEFIEVKVFKLFISVKIHGATMESFSDSVGILGDFYTGRMLSRDGESVMTNDPDMYGAEWQLTDSDPKLFHSPQEPQYPAKCIPAHAEKSTRKLRHGITLGKARDVCSEWGDDIEDCVFDIMATGDIDIAGAF